MKNKKVVIIIVVIVAIIVLALGGLGIAYATTDFLKSNETLFYKYLGKATKNISNFETKELDEYFTKLNETPYESEGTLSVSVDAPEDIGDSEIADKINNMNISFKGKVDKAKQKAEQDIKINYSDDVNFPISYKHTKDIYGIASNLIVNQYIAIDSGKASSLLNNLEMTDKSLSNIQDELSNIDSEELSNILEDVKEVLLSNITKDNFSKTKEGNYVLTLNEKQTVKIFTEILEKVKESSIMTDEYVDAIDEELEQINENADSFTTDKFMSVSVNKNNGLIIIEIVDVGTVSIQINENTIYIWPQMQESEDVELAITIQKNQESEDSLSYGIYLEVKQDATMTISFEADFSGISGTNPKEDYTIGVLAEGPDSSFSYDYNFNVAKKLVDKIDITDFAEGDAVILNDMSEEYISQLTVALMLQIQKVNEVQMQQLGWNYPHLPWYYMYPMAGGMRK